MVYHLSMCREGSWAQMSGIWTDEEEAHFENALPELESCGSEVTNATMHHPKA